MYTNVQMVNLMQCPACDKPIMASVDYRFEPGELVGKEITLTAKLAGIKVSHDCIPKTTRGNVL